MSDVVWKDKNISQLQAYNLESHRLTLESIQQALLALLDEKPFNKITIQELVERAGVSRSAFYRNYQSKEQVLQSIVYDSFAANSKQVEIFSKSPSKTSLAHLLVLLINNYKNVSNICKAGAWQSETLLHCLNLYFSDYISSASLQIEDEQYMRFIMGGIHNVIQFWLENGMKDTPEELASKLVSFITHE